MSKANLFDVNHGDLPETQGIDAQCVRNAEQAFKEGTKTLEDYAVSTASPEKVADIQSDQEVVTQKQAKVYIEELTASHEVVPVPPAVLPDPVPPPEPPAVQPEPGTGHPNGFDLVPPPSPLRSGEFQIVSTSPTPRGPVKAIVRVPGGFSQPPGFAAWPDGTTLSVTQNPYGEVAAPFSNPSAGGGVLIFMPVF